MLFCSSIELILSYVSGFFSKYSSVNHLLSACFDKLLLFFASSNLSFTICCCFSVLLNIEQSRINDSSLSLYFDAKFLAIKEPIEKPTK